MKWFGWLSYLIILGFSGLAFFGLFSVGQTQIPWELIQDPYLQNVLIFSLKQAAYSALLSVVLAIPVALTSYFRPGIFASKEFQVLCLLAFVLPSLVLITGLVALLGRSGVITPWAQQLLSFWNIQWNLYGLTGILMAHVYLNFPFAIRSLHLQLSQIPESSWRLARHLKLTPWQQWRTLIWPNINQSVFLLLGFIGILCFNSFAVVLALGGGPKSTTLEVAIFQALKYDFNIGEALLLAWLQLLIAGGAFLLISNLGQLNWLNLDVKGNQFRPKLLGFKRLISATLYGASWLVLLAPLLAIFHKLIDPKFFTLPWASISLALGRSIFIALAASVLALVLAYGLLLPIRSSQKKWQQQSWYWLANHTLILPAMVLSVGIYIWLLPRFSPEDTALLWLVAINALVIIPFAITQLKSALLTFDTQYQRLMALLKLPNPQRWWIEFKFLNKPFVTSFALCWVLAVGDVAVFAIFGNQDWVTLPWLIYTFAGSYRLTEAAMAAFVLLAISGLAVWILERSIRVKH